MKLDAEKDVNSAVAEFPDEGFVPTRWTVGASFMSWGSFAECGIRLGASCICVRTNLCISEKEAVGMKLDAEKDVNPAVAEFPDEGSVPTQIEGRIDG